jgi:hypothetical protein
VKITSVEQLEAYLEKVNEAARKAHEWISKQPNDPIEFLRRVKFEKIGYHPIDGHEINLIEQVNQTWTYAVALKATRLLFERHPDAEGFTLAPGATASQDLDIMSIRTGLVGAETFAATSPGSNGKLKKDLTKLRAKERDYKHRYLFYSAPTHPTTARQFQLESGYQGIEVWSLNI